MPALDTPPVSAEEFAGLMERLGGFERRPSIAVAVSGGADSMALALLASAWARTRGGEACALTVDHGLRSGSADEAARVETWMAAHGIAHRVLVWRGDKPVTGIQAAARAARYRLLLEWCRTAGVLHLLLAHHRDDQAETVLFRLGRGSGVDGLAGMAAVTEADDARLLRPLLGIARSRLTATLRGAGQSWIEDPSNSDPRFARVRLRAALAEAAAGEFTAIGLAGSAASLAAVRRYLEDRANALLAHHVTIHPAAFAWCSPAMFDGRDEVCLRALARLLRCIGGAPYAPRRERLGRLLAAMRRGGQGWTLGGCRILMRRGRFLVCRESAAMAGEVAVVGDRPVVWDGRFRLIGGPGTGVGLRLGALGRDGWQDIAKKVPELREIDLPAPVRPTLPAFRDALGVCAVPHLGYNRARDTGLSTDHSIIFRPPGTLTVVGRCLV